MKEVAIKINSCIVSRYRIEKERNLGTLLASLWARRCP
jgi:hypothetical protein